MGALCTARLEELGVPLLPPFDVPVGVTEVTAPTVADGTGLSTPSIEIASDDKVAKPTAGVLLARYTEYTFFCDTNHVSGVRNAGKNSVSQGRCLRR